MNSRNPEKKALFVTGGCGFIGTNFIRHALAARPAWTIVNLDLLTYAGNPANFQDLPEEAALRYHLVQGDIGDGGLLETLFSKQPFDAIVHFAAESHVDRSILGPEAFVQTNVIGTFRLLEAVRRSWEKHGRDPDFRFLNVSTDEVYGSLGPDGFFSETSRYDPSSPYSASKAAADHFVRAYFRTYGLPSIITNCSNNYGPFQFPEKLIPLMILNIVEQKPLPVYGDGKNIRDWLYVLDHCEALLRVLEDGSPGETYNIGGGEERENLQIVYELCDCVDRLLERSGSHASRNLVHFVSDRPGHDRRYAIDASKIQHELGWKPRFRLKEALEATAAWYLEHTEWVDFVRSGAYRSWIDANYRDR